ncbi:MAG: hypothetical protein ACR2NP_12440 [Pirellulaceae bacterium]
MTTQGVREYNVTRSIWTFVSLILRANAKMTCFKSRLMPYACTILVCISSLIMPTLGVCQDSESANPLEKLVDAFGGEMPVSAWAFSVEGTIVSERSLGEGTWRLEFVDGKHFAHMTYRDLETQYGYDGTYYWRLNSVSGYRARANHLGTGILPMLAMPAMINELFQFDGEVEVHEQTEVEGQQVDHIVLKDFCVHDEVHLFLDEESGLPLKMRFLRQSRIKPGEVVDTEYLFDFDVSENGTPYVMRCQQFSDGSPRMTIETKSIIFDPENLSFIAPDGLRDLPPRR